MAFLIQTKVKTCNELLYEFEQKNNCYKGEKLNFTGVIERDVYNITAPFEDNGQNIIAGRVERRESEISDIVFFRYENENWIPLEGSISYRLQDPFITKIKGELIFGGTDVYPHPEIGGALGYKLTFYRGRNINCLKKFSEGPEMMKDIRLFEMDNGKIAVFTRPQGNVGGRGKIGFTIINDIDELSSDVINNANLIDKQFIDAEWGGANEIHRLKNGLLGVLGHVACFDKNMDRHYYSMVFAFNPKNLESTEIKIIAQRKNFSYGQYKRKDIMDVIFSGGIKRLDSKKAELYVGVSDAEAHKIIIDDPFIEYEL